MPPTMRQLRRWHRSLLIAHERATKVSDEAEGTLEYDDWVALADPLPELHVAVGALESWIEERGGIV